METHLELQNGEPTYGVTINHKYQTLKIIIMFNIHRSKKFPDKLWLNGFTVYWHPTSDKNIKILNRPNHNLKKFDFVFLCKN